MQTGQQHKLPHCETFPLLFPFAHLTIYRSVCLRHRGTAAGSRGGEPASHQRATCPNQFGSVPSISVLITGRLGGTVQCVHSVGVCACGPVAAVNWPVASIARPVVVYLARVSLVIKSLLCSTEYMSVCF